MYSKLPIIQALWIGDALSPLEQLCVKSFLDHGHEFHLYTYAEVADIPTGTVVRDAREIIAAEDVFKNAGSYAGFSDWFRFEVVHKNGGFYVDMDMVCLKPFDFQQEIIFATETIWPLLSYNSAIMKFPAGHPAVAAMAAASRHPDRIPPWGDKAETAKRRAWQVQGKKREDSDFGELAGPHTFTHAMLHFELTQHAAAPICFMPLPPNDWSALFDRSVGLDDDFFKSSYAVHLWNEMARQSPWHDKNARFDSESLFERLKRRHGIAHATNAPMISHETITRHKMGQQRRKKVRKIKAIGAGVALSFLAGCAAGWWLGQ